MKEYGPCPYGASTLVAFRKRFREKNIAVILEASIPNAEKEKDDPRVQELEQEKENYETRVRELEHEKENYVIRTNQLEQEKE